MKAMIDRMALDLDILALQHMPAGYHEVITYSPHYCSLDGVVEFPGAVTMRADDDPDRVLWAVCSRWSSRGVRYDEPGFDDDPPYVHPAMDEDGTMITIVRHDKAAD